MIICDETVLITDEMKNNRCFLLVDNPKLVYLRLVEEFFISEFEYFIHPKAEINKKAKIIKKYLLEHLHILVTAKLVGVQKYLATVIFMRM